MMENVLYESSGKKDLLHSSAISKAHDVPFSIYRVEFKVDSNLAARRLDCKSNMLTFGQKLFEGAEENRGKFQRSVRTCSAN